GGLRSVVNATMVPCPRRSPHSIFGSHRSLPSARSNVAARRGLRVRLFARGIQAELPGDLLIPAPGCGAVIRRHADEACGKLLHGGDLVEMPAVIGRKRDAPLVPPMLVQGLAREGDAPAQQQMQVAAPVG